jgi:hypothetical protein
VVTGKLGNPQSMPGNVEPGLYIGTGTADSYAPPAVLLGPPLAGAPFFRLRQAESISYFQAPAPTFSITQKVILLSRFSVNNGILSSGRRPDRPGLEV